MNILVTGANGQLGNEMRLISRQYFENQEWMDNVTSGYYQNYCEIFIKEDSF